MQFAGMGFSEEQGAMLDIAANFCRDKSPIATVRKLMDSDTGFDAVVWDEMAALGWLAIAIPEEHGGVGLGVAEVVPVVEQMGRSLLASPFATTTIASQILLAGATPSQAGTWLSKVAAGAVMTTATSEENGDWDLTQIDAQAVADGDNIRLTGTKHFVLWAQNAEAVIVSVLYKGKPAFVLLPAQSIPAGALHREAIIDETKRSFALVLDGIILPAEALLDVEKAAHAFDTAEMTAALLQAAESIGGTQNVIDYTLGYMTTRKQFGKLIGEYQALKHPMVDAYVAYEKARSLLYSAAHTMNDQGQGEVAIRMASAAADKAYSFAADRAIQFHGGFGFTHDCDAGLHRRAAIFAASQSGDAAWHRSKLASLIL
jgi:alkylation response protein AidB-like acyl-CoA dehydrogenase